MVNKQTETSKQETEVRWTAYLIGSSVKTVRQELQLSDGADLGGHLYHSDQLFAIQTPQMKQVGATTSGKPLTITANTSHSLLIC